MTHHWHYIVLRRSQNIYYFTTHKSLFRIKNLPTKTNLLLKDGIAAFIFLGNWTDRFKLCNYKDKCSTLAAKSSRCGQSDEIVFKHMQEAANGRKGCFNQKDQIIIHLWSTIKFCCISRWRLSEMFIKQNNMILFTVFIH